MAVHHRSSQGTDIAPRPVPAALNLPHWVRFQSMRVISKLKSRNPSPVQVFFRFFPFPSVDIITEDDEVLMDCRVAQQSSLFCPHRQPPQREKCEPHGEPPNAAGKETRRRTGLGHSQPPRGAIGQKGGRESSNCPVRRRAHVVYRGTMAWALGPGSMSPGAPSGWQALVLKQSASAQSMTLSPSLSLPSLQMVSVFSV